MCIDNPLLSIKAYAVEGLAHLDCLHHLRSVLSLFLFGVYTLLECRTHDTQEHWQLLLLSQTVKLSGWSHSPSRALSHDRVHVLPPDHDSSPLMTRHVAGPYLSYLSATLLIGCHTFL